MGSITHVEEGGKVLNHYEYDAWGNLTVCEEQTENRFKFTGQQLDPISQQYYLRARYYNPVIGRFTREDTYYEDGLNLYAYCWNNPVYYVDPSGNICDPAAERICKLIDEGRIKGQNRTKLEQYLRENAGNLTRAEKDIAKKLGVNGNGGAKNGTSTKPNQVHHFATNKSKKYTSQFESIAKKYGLDLDGDWNKQLMPHQGRHPYALIMFWIICESLIEKQKGIKHNS